MPRKLNLDDLIFDDAEPDEEKAVIVEQPRPVKKGRQKTVKKVSKKVVIEESDEEPEDIDEVEYEVPEDDPVKSSRIVRSNHTDELSAILEQNKKMMEKMDAMEQRYNSMSRQPLPVKPRRGFAW